MSGIGEQRHRVGHDAEHDLQHHQPNVERSHDREYETEVLGRVTVPMMTVPVIMRMLRMMVLTMLVLGVLVFAVIVLAVVMIVLVRGHAQPIAETMGVTLSPCRAIPQSRATALRVVQRATTVQALEAVALRAI